MYRVNIDQDMMVSHNVLNCHLHFSYAIIKIIVSFYIVTFIPVDHVSED